MGIERDFMSWTFYAKMLIEFMLIDIQSQDTLKEPII